MFKAGCGPSQARDRRGRDSREFTMSFHTIKDGEQVLIFNRGGSGRVVVGPRRVRERVCGKRMLLGRVVSRSQKL